MYAPRKPLRRGLLPRASPSNRLTSCSSSSWNLPGIILKRGIAKIRISAAATSRNAETSIAEIRPGFTSLMPKRLTRFVSCSTASRIVSCTVSDRPGGPTRIDAIRNTATAASQITSSRLRCFVMGWRGFFSFCFFKTAPPPLRWPALPARRPGPERPDTDRRRCGRSSMSALPISPFLLDSFWFFCVDIPAKSRIDYNAPAFSPQPPHIIFNGLLTPQNVGFLRNTRLNV